MKRHALTTKGFATTELLIALAVIVVIGVVGGIVYHQDHKTKPTSTSSTTQTQTSKNSNSSKAATPPADPYAGWQTASLKYEQATFKYPSSWQISNTSKDEAGTGGTATPGADSVTLTSPTGLMININTGQAYTVDDSGMANVLSGAQPIQTLGGTYYLDFYNFTDSTSPTDAAGACLDKSATTSNEAPYITSKNIMLANVAGANASPAADTICIQYQNAQGSLVPKPVSTFEQDASYNDAKLIIESLSY